CRRCRGSLRRREGRRDGSGDSHIRHAWDPTKSVAQNLAEMGLAEDPNKAVPIPKKKLLVSAGMEVESSGWEQGKKIVRKPYVVNEMEYEASLPEKKSNTLSRDLIDYVRYMIQNHGENYKVSTGCPRARSTWSDSVLDLLQDGNCACYLLQQQGWGPQRLRWGHVLLPSPRVTFLPAAWETGLGVPSLPRSWRAAQSDQPLLLTKGRSDCTKVLQRRPASTYSLSPMCSPASTIGFPGPSAPWPDPAASCL
uniref:Nucleolar protein 16 n=1 Tax=Buteo japonicus TaxID=224669 RepID=A0A8C0B2N3_9AVES